jgi:Mrp family chromosome partitioning ATPase
MRELVGQALGNYDFVVVDSPALLINAADARILAALVDGVVLVVRSGATPRDMVQRARSQVPNVMGVVLNKLDVGLFADYYQGYYGADGKSAGASEEREAGRLRVSPKGETQLTPR